MSGAITNSLSDNEHTCRQKTCCLCLGFNNIIALHGLLADARLPPVGLEGRLPAPHANMHHPKKIGPVTSNRTKATFPRPTRPPCLDYQVRCTVFSRVLWRWAGLSFIVCSEIMANVLKPPVNPCEIRQFEKSRVSISELVFLPGRVFCMQTFRQ